MSVLKIGINGFGRIGRLAFRAISKRANVEVVGINDLQDVDYIAYLLKYDSVHGTFPSEVKTENGNLVVDGKTIRITAEKDPNNLKWNELGVDVVLECTGLFTTLEKAQAHLNAGAKKVVISAPSADAPMFVMGVNHKSAKATDTGETSTVLKVKISPTRLKIMICPAVILAKSRIIREKGLVSIPITSTGIIIGANHTGTPGVAKICFQ